MANTQDIFDFALKTAVAVTASPESWERFLFTAAHNYNSTYLNQLLIHAQRPDATACASMKYWNEQALCKVRLGSKSIVILRRHNGQPTMQRVFALEDLEARGHAPTAMPWAAANQTGTEIVQRLMDNNPGAWLVRHSNDAAYEQADHASRVLERSVADSTLEWANKNEQLHLLHELVVKSAVYMAYIRLGLPVPEEVTRSFKYVTQFDTAAVSLCLGGYLQTVAKPILEQIGQEAKRLNSYVLAPGDSVANLSDPVHNTDTRTTTTRNSREEASHNDVHEPRWILDPLPDPAYTAEHQSEPLRTDAAGISGAERADAVRPNDAGRNADAELPADGPASREDGGQDVDRPDAAHADARPQNEPAGLGTDGKQPEDTGRGNDSADAVHGVTEESAQAESEQSPSAFSFPEFPDELLPQLLKVETTSRAPNADYIAYFQKQPLSIDRLRFVRESYKDIFTELILADDTRVGFHKQDNGLLVWQGGFLTRTAETLLPWRMVANELNSLIQQQELIAAIDAKALPEPDEQLSFELPEDALRGDESGMEKTADIRSAEEQEKSIKAQAPTLSHTYRDPLEDNGTHITDEDVYHALAYGSGFQGGKFRIYQFFTEGYGDRAAFLKKEYGIGGWSIDYLDGTRGWLDHDAKGIKLRYNGEKESYERLLHWLKAAKHINYLIEMQRYLTPQEMERYPEWKQEQEIRQQQIQAATSTELSQEKPVCKIGSVVYLEHGHKFTVESIGIADVHLQDEEYPLFGRAVSRAEFQKLLDENPQNRGMILEESRQPEVQEPETVETTQDEPEPTTFVEQVMQDVERLSARQPPIEYERTNYLAPYAPTVPEGTKAKFKANIEAIRALKAVEQRIANGGAPANEQEQNILDGYLGWGGLADAFDEKKDSWHAEYTELKQLLTEDEYSAARESTLTAFYTPPAVIHAIYRALERIGCVGGNVLEPSMGVGAFFGHRHSQFDLNNAKLYGVELDSLSGRIAQQLYQKAKIQITGYEKADLPDSFFDLAIGNVPFGQYQVSDRRYDRLHFQIHDYFLAKTVDKLRVGGIMAFITTSGTLDKQTEDVRRYLAARCDLLGAVRLPNNTFKSSAGTQVTSDILFLQKRGTVLEKDVPWIHIGQTADGVPVNQYFADHPEMICGTMQMESGPYGLRPTCAPLETELTLEQQLDKVLENIHAEYTLENTQEETQEETDTIDADTNVRNFSYTVKDNVVYYRENSKMRVVKASATALHRIRALILLRDTCRELIDAQLENYSDESITKLQARLNRQYDAYRQRFGLINSRGSAMAFREDSGYFLLCSLEDLDDEGHFKGKTDMFTKRTIRPAQAVDRVDSADEALALSLTEKACVDLAYMQQLTGKPQEEIISDLTSVIFHDPEKNAPDGSAVYRPGDEYLSGNVRQKLSIARLAARSDKSYQVNVQALEQVQPKDLEASEISVRLGATWIPEKYVKQFLDELLDAPLITRRVVDVHFAEFTGDWTITNKLMGEGNIKATVTYGTNRANAYVIAENALNLRPTKVRDRVEDIHGNKSYVINKAATQEAQEKQRLLCEKFTEWIFKEPSRRQELVTLYNMKFNSLRPREYDGTHLNFPGMNPEITLRPHQRNAIAHVLYGNNVLLAHEVGAGKTYEMVASAMEKKRLGLCSKTLIVVPNHLTEQMASEALLLYPNAEILVAKKSDFEKANRKKFCARIATGNYDIIVIGHSQFEKIPLSFERQQMYLQQQIDEVIDQTARLKAERAENFTIKQMERMKKVLQKKLDKLNDQARKDDVVTFEQLGVDSLMVDEAHYFKNAMITTKMHNVAGISQSESQKASDMLMKCMYLDELTGGHGIVFATGTPISNSMTEMYVMMRYLQHGLLEREGLLNFDAWASTFGESVTAIELAPEGTGYRSKTRFARFYNLPELMSMFKMSADIQTADMLHLPVPELKGGKPTNVVLQPSEIQRKMVADLGERAEKVRSGTVKPNEDNMLRITNDGRKLALDQRLIDPLLPDDPNSKANACVEQVYEIWEQSKPEKSTQMIFCDLSTPKADGFSVYNDIRDKLVAKGIPKEEIQFIHDADTETKKAELFGKVRSGAVRVLMGSTQKMGAGTNVQTRLIALHHLDCPWRPADIAQRNGRMVRQGNMNKEVSIFIYVTESTFDAYSWQLVENKQKFISQIMTSKSPARSCEDFDEQALSYAEVKALAAGNPMIKEKMDLDIQVSRLRGLKAAYTSQHYRLEDAITGSFPRQIKGTERKIAAYEQDIQTAKQNQTYDADNKLVFGIELNGVQYDKREDAGKALLGLIGAAVRSEKPVPVGHYAGFEVTVEYVLLSKKFKANLVGAATHTTALGADAAGNMTRFQNVITGLPQATQDLRDKLEQLGKQLENAKEELKQPFLQEEELAEKSARLATLDALLNVGNEEQEIEGEAEEVDECTTNEPVRNEDELER